MIWQNWHLRLIDALTFIFSPFSIKLQSTPQGPLPLPTRRNSAVLHDQKRNCHAPFFTLLLLILGRCGAVEWNSPQNLSESCLSPKILHIRRFFKSGIQLFCKKFLLFRQKAPAAGGGIFHTSDAEAGKDKAPAGCRITGKFNPRSPIIAGKIRRRQSDLRPLQPGCRTQPRRLRYREKLQRGYRDLQQRPQRHSGAGSPEQRHLAGRKGSEARRPHPGIFWRKIRKKNFPPGCFFALAVLYS